MKASHFICNFQKCVDTQTLVEKYFMRLEQANTAAYTAILIAKPNDIVVELVPLC